MQQCQGRAVAGKSFAPDSGGAAPGWLQSPRPEKSGSEMGRATGPVRETLLCGDCQNGCAGAWRIAEPEHEMLGDAAAARCPAPAHPAGFDGAAQGVSAAISWCDVFRLRRRIFDGGLPKTRARCVQSESPCC